MIRVPKEREPQHPGEILLGDYLKPLGISQVQLAKSIGVTYARLNELIHGKRNMTVDTALRLERFFGVSAQSWLNAQLRCDIYHVARAGKTVKALSKIRPMRAA